MNLAISGTIKEAKVAEPWRPRIRGIIWDEVIGLGRGLIIQGIGDKKPILNTIGNLNNLNLGR